MRPTRGTAPRAGKRHVLRWVAVAAVVILAAGTLVAYVKYREVYDSITRVNVPGSELGQRPPEYSTDSENILVYGDDSRKGRTSTSRSSCTPAATRPTTPTPS